MGLHSQVILDDTCKRNYYFPGETLNGNIVVTSDSDRQVKGLKLRIWESRIYGERAQIPQHAWVNDIKRSILFYLNSELDTKRYERSAHTNIHDKFHSQHHHHTTTSSSDYVDVVYNQEETYLDVTLNIFGYVGGEWTVKSGRFTYPFQFVLPLGLPSSFVGEFGSIEYSLGMVIGQSWAFDHSSNLSFQVVSVVDLNVDPTAQMPIVVKACKTFGVIFQSGPLDVTLRLPRGGAVVGESVPFVAEVFNKSDKTVTESLSIYKEIEYFARGKSKSQRKSVVEILGQTLQPGADHIWQHNTALRVPPTEPSTFATSSRLINIKYKVVLEMKVSGIGFNLDAISPFVIGNVPFRNVSYQTAAQNVSYQPTAPEQPGYDPPPPYTEKALPTKTKQNDEGFELV